LVNHSWGDTTDDVAKDIINEIGGKVEIVTQKDNVDNNEIGIVTKYEYCLVYHPEDDEDKVYVQISNRRYNFFSKTSPYKSSHSTNMWYRKHYYSSSYEKDSKRYKAAESPYRNYDGDTIYIGDSYYDFYAESVRQDSVGTRDSSSGGLGSGK
jgi:hypothetical protein